MLLPTAKKNDRRCCLQRQSFFRIVAYDAEKCSNFSSCYFLRCCLQRRSFFRIVDHSTEKWSALLHTERKNYRVVDNNAEKCSNSNISTNSKPYANLHCGFNHGLGWCFMKRSWGEKSRGTVPLSTESIPLGSGHPFSWAPSPTSSQITTAHS
jgi:hypothetical protein